MGSGLLILRKAAGVYTLVQSLQYQRLFLESWRLALLLLHFVQGGIVESVSVIKVNVASVSDSDLPFLCVRVDPGVNAYLQGLQYQRVLPCE